MTEAVTEAVTVQEITITRVFDAPRELVWKAWTEPDQLAQWWGRRGWTTPLSTITMDVRPGGTFRPTAVSDEDGAEMPSDLIYREVVEPKRLVFAEAADSGCPEVEGAVANRHPQMDFRLELVPVPVSDVDRAKAFYTEKVGFTRTTTTGSATSCASSS